MSSVAMSIAAGWETAHARSAEFLSNAGLLWLQSNFDQKVFLAAWGAATTLCLYLIYRHLKWRFVNRKELRKMAHYANIRSLFGQQDPVAETPRAVCQLPKVNLAHQRAS